MVSTSVFPRWLGFVVGVAGIEPATSCSQSRRAPAALHPAYYYVNAFIDYRKATKGLTESGEKWLRDVLNTFIKCLTPEISFINIQRDDLVKFLARYEDKPWRRHSFYRAFRTFFKWASITYDTPNPFLDRHGNSIIDAPKTPSMVLYTITPGDVQKLIEATTSIRNKAMLSLLADSGARRGEIVSILTNDVDLENRRIKIMGKGQKEGFLIFGQKTKVFLEDYIGETNPSDNLFGLTASGFRAVLVRLEKKTGILCHAHSFRRGFAVALRKQGLNDLDIMQLGRWSSVDLVKRYTKAYTFDDAARRYKAIIE